MIERFSGEKPTLTNVHIEILAVMLTEFMIPKYCNNVHNFPQYRQIGPLFACAEVEFVNVQFR
jgi:hypothetical protein